MRLEKGLLREASRKTAHMQSLPWSRKMYSDYAKDHVPARMLDVHVVLMARR